MPRVFGDLGKSAQTTALNHQVEASNLWDFFQAKTIRQTLTLVPSEAEKIDAAARRARKDAISKRIDNWTKTAARYQSEPEAGGARARARAN